MCFQVVPLFGPQHFFCTTSIMLYNALLVENKVRWRAVFLLLNEGHTIFLIYSFLFLNLLDASIYLINGLHPVSNYFRCFLHMSTSY